MERVAVGSTNPVKVGSARRIFAELFAEVDVIGISVPSEVSNQPVGEAETALGALNRAKAALAATGADWGIGLEGGVMFDEHEACWMVNVCAVVHRDGRTSVGKGAQFELPPVIARGVRAGGEVGHLVDDLMGLHNSKQQGGAIGVLTNGLVVREDLFAHTVAAALVRFLHPELYHQ